MTQADSPRYLLLGELLRPHGVRGEVRMRVLTDYPERIVELDHVYLSPDEDGSDAQTYEIESLRMHQQYALVKFAGVDDRNDAERMRELFVLVDIENAVPLEEGEVYLFQIIGMNVALESGERFGTVKDIIETGANDVYVIDSEQYGEVLIPAIPSVVVQTDPESRTITIRPMEGMLPG